MGESDAAGRTRANELCSLSSLLAWRATKLSRLGAPTGSCLIDYSDNEARLAINEQSMQPDAIYAICGFDDIPNRRARGFDLMVVDDEGNQRPWPIVVIRWGKKVLGYVNKCPHNSVKLDWERNEFLDPYGVRLMCGKHGSTFELSTGRCVEGQCKGRVLTPIALTVLDGEICVVGVRLVEDDAPSDA